MLDSGPTLSDVLAKVPHLLPRCMLGLSRSGRGESIKNLRLISKEISVSVLQAVTSCEVELGEGACPEPQQVVRLMQYSKVETLCVSIVTTSGTVLVTALLTKL